MVAKLAAPEAGTAGGAATGSSRPIKATRMAPRLTTRMRPAQHPRRHPRRKQRRHSPLLTRRSTSMQASTTPLVRGDTAFSISKRYNITQDNLRGWNNLADNTISVGQVLHVKPAGYVAPAGGAATPAATTPAHDRQLQPRAVHACHHADRVRCHPHRGRHHLAASPPPAILLPISAATIKV